MPQKLQILRTSTANQAPANLSLAPGELAVEMNSNPPKLWVGVTTAIDAVTGMKLLCPSGGVTVADAAPAAPKQGDLWFESDTMILWLWYDDGNTGQWLQMNGGGGGGVTVADTPPAGAAQGDLWWESDTGILWIYFVDANSSQWVQAAGSGGGGATGDWVDVAGDTMTGGLTIDNASGLTVNGIGVFNYGVVRINHTTVNPSVELQGGGISWDRTADALAISLTTSPAVLSLRNNGTINGGNGYNCRTGNAGAYGANCYNFNFTGPVDCWIDASNLGTITITSDYRIKKDVIDLPGMWDTVKALRPIKYTHQDYTPQIEQARAVEIGQPFMAGDDIERWGFIAHELQDTLTPSAATGVKDSPTHIQSPNPFTLLAALTKALQETMTRLEAVEAQLAVARR